MKKYCAILLTFLSLFAALFFTQCKPQATTEKTQDLNAFTQLDEAQIYRFPEDWVGNWAGKLYIHSPKRAEPMEIDMQLNIQPADSADQWTWEIIYKTDSTTDKRPYLLKPIDRKIGHYVIDELNDIILDGYQRGNSFYSRFEVQKNLIEITYHYYGKELVFELLSGKNENPNLTGGTSEDIPEVKSYPVSVGQRAFLRRTD